MRATLTDRLQRAACRQKVTGPCLKRALSEEETFASSLLPELTGQDCTFMCVVDTPSTEGQGGRLGDSGWE